MFLPPIDLGGLEDRPPRPPRPSRRKSLKLPWSRSTKSKKLQITQGAMVADGEEQQPASRQQSTVSSYDDSNKQVDTEYGSEATTDAQDQLTIDSRATSAYSTDKVTVSNADTDQIELSHAHNGVASQDDDTQTLAEFFEQDRKVTETGAPDAALSKLPSAAAAETPKAHEKKDSLPESIKYDENGEPILHLHYTKAQVELIASEIYDQTVAETTLGLFVDWIREKPENFELATKHIRELATDRGYKVERTNNPHLCELVRQVNDMRPSEAKSPVICEHAPYIRTPQSYAAVREPDDMCSFADPPSKDLPASLRQIRNRVVYPSYLSSPLSSPTRDFPPDTPDRPQPLSLRSRASGASHLTPTTAYRSVSAPLGSSPANTGMLSPIKFPRGSLILEEMASHPLLTEPSSPANPFSPHVGKDDVFGIVNKQGVSRSSEPNATRGSMGYSDLETARRYASTGHQHQYPPGPYGLSPSEASSGEESDSEAASKAEDADSRDNATFRDDESDLHTYTGSARSSILDSASFFGTEGGPVHYAYADVAVPSEAAQAEIAASRGARQARKKISGPAPATFVSSFHRPLPLRSYESEAHLFPTTGAQGGSSHNRAQSAGSLKRSGKPISLAIEAAPQSAPPLPVRSSSIRANTIPLPPQSESTSGRSRLSSIRDDVEHEGRTTPTVVDPSTGPTPHGSSLAMTLTSFPVPPMHNPVGALPMVVAQATTTNESIHPVAVLLQACTIVTEQAARIKGILEQTRDRGDQLPVANWDSMSKFERSWRSDREELLIAIYGRHDTWLSEEDVEYVDLMWMELRASPSATWVLDLFHHDDEMF